MTPSPTEKPDANTAINVGAQQVAGVYARALLGAGEDSGQTDAIIEQLDSLVVDVLDAIPQFEAVLASPWISLAEKNQLLDKTFGGRASPLFLDFLKVVSEHGRLDVLRDIRRVAHLLYDELRDRVRIRVTTATPLDGDLAARIAETLRGMLGQQPRLEQAVDPALIGGLVLRVGDTIFDGSVATRLARVREQMITRSVHEIQRRRDRFSNSAGN
jgi:F-type H+-transporting ATPase subunit delta